MKRSIRRRVLSRQSRESLLSWSLLSGSLPNPAIPQVFLDVCGSAEPSADPKAFLMSEMDNLAFYFPTFCLKLPLGDSVACMPLPSYSSLLKTRAIRMFPERIPRDLLTRITGEHGDRRICLRTTGETRQRGFANREREPVLRNSRGPDRRQDRKSGRYAEAASHKARYSLGYLNLFLC